MQKKKTTDLRVGAKPLVVRDLFDSQTQTTILRFMDEHAPYMPWASDLAEPDSMNKFGRLYGHNPSFFVAIHHQLAEYASDLFGQKLKPSYVFLSMYEAGGICPLHIDRPQCRYTIDYLIRQESTVAWPIDIGPEMPDAQRDAIEISHPQTPEDRQAVIDSVDWTRCLLAPNDAVCYSGTNAWHYRPFASTGKADLAFFHFVPEAFDGPLD